MSRTTLQLLLVPASQSASTASSATRKLQASGSESVSGGSSSITLNCGYGRGYSVLETIEAVRRVSMRNFAVSYAPRRPGDIMTMVADTSRIRGTLNWTPQFDNLETIATHALAWEEKLFRDRGGLPQHAESA